MNKLVKVSGNTQRVVRFENWLNLTQKILVSQESVYLFLHDSIYSYNSQKDKRYKMDLVGIRWGQSSLPHFGGFSLCKLTETRGPNQQVDRRPPRRHAKVGLGQGDGADTDSNRHRPFGHLAHGSRSTHPLSRVGSVGHPFIISVSPCLFRDFGVNRSTPVVTGYEPTDVCGDAM